MYRHGIVRIAAIILRFDTGINIDIGHLRKLLEPKKSSDNDNICCLWTSVNSDIDIFLLGCWHWHGNFKKRKKNPTFFFFITAISWQRFYQYCYEWHIGSWCFWLSVMMSICEVYIGGHLASTDRSCNSSKAAVLKVFVRKTKGTPSIAPWRTPVTRKTFVGHKRNTRLFTSSCCRSMRRSARVSADIFLLSSSLRAAEGSAAGIKWLLFHAVARYLSLWTRLGIESTAWLKRGRVHARRIHTLSPAHLTGHFLARLRIRRW